MNTENFLEDLALPKRSTFLTVLCILTFIGSGYGILTSAFSYSMFRNGKMKDIQANQAKTIEKMKESKSANNDLAVKLMENSAAMMDPEKMRQSVLFKLLSCVLTLTGALLMFNQKIIGYVLYIIGCVLAVCAMLYIYGTDNFVTTISVSVTGVISVVFIILYGMCVKEMVPQKTV